MQFQNAVPPVEDIDLGTLGRALWRAKTWIVGLAIGAGVVTFAGLSMVRPLYTSESRILIENDVSPFTRAATDLGRDQLQALDEQAVQSQVQVLTSRDLALDVAKSLDLANNPEFANDVGVNLLGRLMSRFGLGRGSEKSVQDKAADAFEEHLTVYALNKSSVIAVDYTSGDPDLAAKTANKLAEAYIDWQLQAKLEQTKDVTTWLNAQIEELRKKVADSEAAAEQFRSTQGLFEGPNNVTLNAQQLSELNNQVILAKAQKSEAETRARLISKMLAEKSDIDATPEVLKSELIGRMIEHRVQVQRQLAELSATLLPSHPRIKQLYSELADVRSQIRQEGEKIVRGLENEAEVASARETSLRNSLNEVKSQASSQSEAEIKLRALEREAKANRDLHESYLARYATRAPVTTWELSRPMPRSSHARTPPRCRPSRNAGRSRRLPPRRRACSRSPSSFPGSWSPVRRQRPLACAPPHLGRNASRSRVLPRRHPRRPNRLHSRQRRSLLRQARLSRSLYKGSIRASRICFRPCRAKKRRRRAVPKRFPPPRRDRRPSQKKPGSMSCWRHRRPRQKACSRECGARFPPERARLKSGRASLHVPRPGLRLTPGRQTISAAICSEGLPCRRGTWPGTRGARMQFRQNRVVAGSGQC